MKWIMENKVLATIIFLAIVGLIIWAVKYFMNKDGKKSTNNTPVIDPHIANNPNSGPGNTGRVQGTIAGQTRSAAPSAGAGARVSSGGRAH